ncbi:hypothetical protein [Longirhabdus pacifica]|uniref:hypothetical protein n=1 Tax=Longirhabdus pacifica TaxID=2305227 RepID=UPI00100920B2|nr:hypothetical protein [Longirhabdus pacifica]
MKKKRLKLTVIYILSVFFIVSGGLSMDAKEKVQGDSHTKEIQSIHGATITLDDFPEIKAPIMTPVFPKHQVYEVTFVEDMDRNSVEKTLKKNFENNYFYDFHYLDKYEEQMKQLKANAILDFKWVNDKQLQLSVQHVFYGDITYNDTLFNPLYEINVSGAKTKSGEWLKDVPSLQAVLYPFDEQLWRVAVDGSKIEQVSSWNELYRPLHIIDDQYAIIVRQHEYICCHGQVPNGHYLYDMINDKIYEYPQESNTFNDVMINYVGHAPFYADKRGFFYQKQHDHIQIQDRNQQQVEINVEGYVHGAVFSKTKQHVLIAASQSEEDVFDLDLIIYSLEDGNMMTLQQVLIGEVALGMGHGYKYPVPIYDNGNEVYIKMMDQFERVYYAFHWGKCEVTTRTFPLQETLMDIEFQESYDGRYQIYGKHVYEKGEEITDKSYEIKWIDNTHKVAYLQWLKDSSDNVVVYDVDQDKEEILVNIEDTIRTLIIGATEEWIYIRTTGDINPL